MDVDYDEIHIKRPNYSIFLSNSLVSSDLSYSVSYSLAINDSLADLKYIQIQISSFCEYFWQINVLQILCTPALEMPVYRRDLDASCVLSSETSHQHSCV